MFFTFQAFCFAFAVVTAELDGGTFHGQFRLHWTAGERAVLLLGLLGGD